MTFSKKIWLAVILLIIAGLSVALIIINDYSSSPNIVTSSLFDDHQQQLSNYLKSIKSELETLQPYLVKQLTNADAGNLLKIRDRLLTLRVPAGYQDFHLSLVIKLSQLEEVLNNKGKVVKTSVTSLQQDLLALLEEFNKLEEREDSPIASLENYN